MQTVISIAHKGVTTKFIKETLAYILAVNPEHKPRNISIQQVGIFVSEVLDREMRKKSAWLPTPETSRGLLSLIRFFPDFHLIIDGGYFEDFYENIFNPYQEEMAELLTVDGVDIAWCEYEIQTASLDTVFILVLGDRRILEWERLSKVRAKKREAYAKAKQTVRYPTGYIRGRF